MEKATLGGGCFWCVEAVLQRLEGVDEVVSGYAGGHVENPSYQQVCSGSTGHAEVVQVSFRPEVISYTDLLAAFFATHDPTTLNRQGNDVGTQYRSVIYYHTEQQKQEAQQVMDAVNASGAWQSPVVTELSPLPVFYPAERYHQNYFNDNREQPYCLFVVKPKVDKLKKAYSDKLKKGM
ncbi:peptide-methionine (S)-S-oxide reductase MsrA [Cesiribacter andamanensis]|uniref:Peptide methionine sulfoxide reductase MsrA n=1 Tax=Cesiribacter andamanensis AMV16 TaxID=1279009 RepID=M7NM64_9BACT|nr:peptide-methionine (S)-S-oxide reductase MsrA [Cesiribacter andamanensis]EMR02870.1 Peptide methionine sulfoxide reductase MsrA [Cesiribacter andamanensis AMV16]